MVETYLRGMLDSSSKAGVTSGECFWLSFKSSGCERFTGDAKKLDSFSSPSLHGPEAGGVPILDFDCSSRHLTRNFFLQDFSPARHLASGLTMFSCPNSSFSNQDNGFITFSQSRHSVFDYATRPATSSFVDAHCAVFSCGQFNYTGLRIPVPSRLNIPVWRALLQDYEDFLTFWLFGIWLAPWLH